MILEEGGVRVEVEDCSITIGQGDDDDDGDEGQGEARERTWSREERIIGGPSMWAPPSQEGTPAGRVRIAPTAMPPR